MRSRSLHVLIAAALSLVAAACGGDTGAGGTSETGGGLGASATTAPPDTDQGGASATTAAAGAPTTTVRAGDPAGPRAPATTAAPVDQGPEATAPAPGSGDVQPTAAEDGSNGPPGAFARRLLRPQPATAIVVERFVQSGAPLAQAAVDRSAGVVSQVAAKPVDVRPAAALSTTDTDWTAEEIRAAADAAARVPQADGGRAVLRLLVVRGTFEGSQDVLGVAVRGDTLALLADNISAAATPLVSRSAIEDAVLLHELGHVLGLVDLARNTGRADKDHPGHSSNSASVMFWAVESSLVGQVLNGPPPRDFDAADLADLRALRDGA